MIIDNYYYLFNNNISYILILTICNLLDIISKFDNKQHQILNIQQEGQHEEIGHPM